MDTVTEFGDALRRLREARGLTLDEVAAAVRAAVPGSKSGHQQISQWEHGERNPRSRLAYVALDDYLQADGAILAAAGLATTPPGDAAPLPVLPPQVAEVMDTLLEAVRVQTAEIRELRVELGQQTDFYEALVALLPQLLARQQESP